MNKFFRVPFALSGTRTPVPDAADPSGFVSYIEGYGADYQRPKTDPLSKNIERDKMNEIFFDITTAVSELQGQGLPDFITTALNGGSPFPYEKNALVRWTDDEVYSSLVAANVALPTDATKWVKGLAYQLNVAGSTRKGVIDKLNYMPWIEDMIQAGDTHIGQALARAAAVGGYWQMGAGPYTLAPTAGLVLVAGMKILFHGTVINHASTSVPTIQANNIDDWALLGSLTIVGNGKAAGTAAGVQRVGGNRFVVENVVCRNISGWGFYEINGTTTPGARGDQGNWINCRAYDCWIGREDIADTSTEYNLWVAFTATGCGIGCITAAGNNQFLGGNIVDNDQGVWVKNGGNHAHGMFVGTNINHNGPLSGGWNVRLTDVTNGQTFTGCHVYGDNAGTGVIWLERSQGFLWEGGTIDCSVFCDTLTGYSMVANNFAPDSVNTQGKFGPGGPNDPSVAFVIMTRNMARSGMWKYNDPGTLYVRATRSGGQAIPSGVETVLNFNAESYDTRNAYNSATGVFTFPWLMNAQFKGAVRVVAAGGIPALGGVIRCYVNGALTFYAPLSAISATEAIGLFDWDIGGAAGATVDVRVLLTSTTGVLDVGSQFVVSERS